MGHAAAVKQHLIRGRGRLLWMVAMAAVLVLAGSLIVATERAGAQSNITFVSNLGRGGLETRIPMWVPLTPPLIRNA